MKKRSPYKNIMPTAAKFLAIFMAICYLVNPMHQQINGILHSLSHGLEVPEFVMDHRSFYSDMNSQVHHSYDHHTGGIDHNHRIIDFINTIFEASNERGQASDYELTVIAVDKHLPIYSYKKEQFFYMKYPKAFPDIPRKLRLGYPPSPLKPPI